MVAYVPGQNEIDKKVWRSLQGLASGRSNGVGTATLTISVTSTTITDANCAARSVVILVPTTAHAAAEIGNGTLYIPVATVTNGSFVIQHASNTQADRIYVYAIVG